DVRFGFGEIGVDRDRRVEIGRQILEDVQPAGERSFARVPSTGDVRADVQAVSLTDALQTSQLAGVSKIPNPTRHARSSPPIRFEEMLDLAFDVEAPNWLIRPEAERLERDRNFGRPAFVGSAHRRVPDAIPVAVQALRIVGDLAVRTRARGVDL